MTFCWHEKSADTIIWYALVSTSNSCFWTTCYLSCLSCLLCDICWKITSVCMILFSICNCQKTKNKQVPQVGIFAMFIKKSTQPRKSIVCIEAKWKTWGRSLRWKYFLIRLPVLRWLKYEYLRVSSPT